MKLELKRISVWSAVKVSFVLNLILGFIIGIFYAFILMILATLPMAAMGEEGAAFSTFAGVAVIFVPFIVAFFVCVIYTIVVAISVALYNLIVKLTGGLEFDFSQVVEVVPVAAPPAFPQQPSGGDQTSTT